MFLFIQVIEEITTGTLIKAPATVTEAPGSSKTKVNEPAAESSEDEESLKEMQSRLQALRS